MLKQILIHNFVFIEKAVIDLEAGLNIITGETGAGKSIFLGALNATLGEKLSTDYIHPQKNSLQVITTFAIDKHRKVKNILTDTLNIVLTDNLLHLKREITKEGKSRCFINDKLTNVQTLKKIASMLIDMHGQNENQHLFNAKYHLNFYDRFLNLEGLHVEFSQQYRRYIDLQNQIKALQAKQIQIQKEREFLLFTVKELKDGLISEEEYNALSDKLKRLENQGAVENILASGEILIEQTLTQIYAYQSDVNKSTSASASDPIKILGEKINALLDAMENVKSHLQEHYSSSSGHGEALSIDDLNQKLASAERLRKKYGKSLSQLDDSLKQTQDKLQFLEDAHLELHEITQQKNSLEKKVIALATELHHKRKDGRSFFEKKIGEEIQLLGMKGGAISIELSSYEEERSLEMEDATSQDKHKATATLSANGFDKAEFLYLPAPNATYKHLKNIASGGEISRIMLSLKSLLHEKYDIPVLVFDEIDVGIGGATALNVGDKLAKLSCSKQVVVITHLPQIAKYANKHFRIIKKLEDQQTTTYIQTLNQHQRVIEIARMLTGNERTPENLDMAKKFLADKIS